MHPFVETISIAAGIGAVLVAAIMALAIFFNVMSWFTGEKNPKLEFIAIRGVLKEDTVVVVHMDYGETFDRVRMLGLTKCETRSSVPFEMNEMVILEDEKHQQYLVRAKDIRTIVVPPNTHSS